MSVFDEVPAWGDEPEPENMSAELDEQAPTEKLPAEIEVGIGIKLKIHPDAFRYIMHQPEITAMVDERGRAIAAEANELAQTEGAEYIWWLSPNQENIRARGRVKTANFKARIDDEAHHTLLNALAMHPSDPYPTYPQSDPEAEGGDQDAVEVPEEPGISELPPHELDEPEEE
jgi:hypothetical protein